MSSPNHDRPHTEDINERRKAQNRVAQKNYRMRQKLRTKLAEAVLRDMPGLYSATALVDHKRKQSWSTLCNEDWLDGSSSSTALSDTITTGGGEIRNVLATSNDPVGTGGRGLHASDAGQDFLTSTTATPPSRSSANGMGMEFGAGSDIRSSPESSAMDGYGIDPALTDWMDIQINSTSLMPTLLPTPPTQTGMSEPETTVMTVEAGTLSPGQASVVSTGMLQEPCSISSLASSDPSVQIATPLPLQKKSSSPHLVSSALLGGTRPASLTRSNRTIAITNNNNNNNNNNDNDSSGSGSGSRSATDLGHPRTGLRSTYTVPTAIPGSSATREFEPTSPLLTAISLGNLQIAQLLLRSGAELDKRDAHGKTALHLAVQRGDIAMAKALLELGADILTADAHGSRLLHTAVENDNMEMINLVLGWCKKIQSSRENGLDASPRSTNITAAGGGRGGEKNREEANVVLRCINAQDGRKMTAVHLCVLLKRAEILEILLDHGADVNIDCT